MEAWRAAQATRGGAWQQAPAAAQAQLEGEQSPSPPCWRKNRAAPRAAEDTQQRRETVASKRQPGAAEASADGRRRARRALEGADADDPEAEELELPTAGRGKRRRDRAPPSSRPRRKPPPAPPTGEARLRSRPGPAAHSCYRPTPLLGTCRDTIEIDEATLKENANVWSKARGLRREGRVDEIHPGRSSRCTSCEPQSGTKISKIAGLSDDLAMALAAQKVRIVAPIPGKARVGFELPNEYRHTVYLRELLEDERWRQMQGALPVAFGKDIVGQPVFGDLAKMPHLLVAGATGSGKSVGLNVMRRLTADEEDAGEVRS